MRKPSTNLSAAFGFCFLLVGVILGASFVFRWLDYRAFENGRIIEGTIAHSHQNDAGEWFVSASFRTNGQDKEFLLEALSSQQAASLAVGDKIVAIQMDNSPSRLILADNLAAVRPDWWEGIIISLPALVGLAAMGWRPILRRRGWDDEALVEMDGRIFGLLVGSLLLFVALGGAISALGEMRDRPIALVLTLMVVLLLVVFGRMFIYGAIRRRDSS
jgi:hypothetical protein